MAAATVEREKVEKPKRAPYIGADVHFWPPHQTQTAAPAEQPEHAVVSSVVGDLVNLAILSRSGRWYARMSIAYSETPKLFAWSWPK